MAERVIDPAGNGDAVYSATVVALASLLWPVPRAETKQGVPAAPGAVSASGWRSKKLKDLEAAALAENPEALTDEQLQKILDLHAEKALTKAARLEKDKRELLLLFARGRDTGLIRPVID